eukprot:GEMP01025322.1.p1 GENE.GEMP01025322.1~~GEMP01025322.1.p1  ORF type:complete len:309 (+),score=30.14 GEMP01025322.1:55-981(+)
MAGRGDRSIPALTDLYTSCPPPPIRVQHPPHYFAVEGAALRGFRREIFAGNRKSLSCCQRKSEKDESSIRKNSVLKSWVNTDLFLQLAYIYSCGILNCLVHNQICNLMFACGCLPMWSPTWPCNVHAHGPSNMRCPWCQPWLSPYTQGWFHLWSLNSSFDQKGLAVLALYASPWKWKFFVFVAVNLTVGFVYKLIFNYTYFLGMGEPPLPVPGTHIEEMDAGAHGGEVDSAGWGLTRYPADWIGYLLLWSIGDVLWVIFFLGVWYVIRYSHAQCCSTAARDESTESPALPKDNFCLTVERDCEAAVLA